MDNFVDFFVKSALKQEQALLFFRLPNFGHKMTFYLKSIRYIFSSHFNQKI
ncbi:hypothetical protein HD_1000 [[Haemophilus] ducreyi 35000HP]|uniref:Uncharacterized protein n=1 Tax=Haemophilus ducreyi (strain 35000HP / ATCC 700724) TaxID=233412 RepID=Q7VMH7_HAEDU|nr:hypothetical protein HD_1000 [[Haemophilus] ducreyi 35000HP]